MEFVRVLNRFRFDRRSSGRPPAAIEITQRGVLAASLSAEAKATSYAFSALEPGAIVPGIDEPNLRSLDAVTNAVRSALEQVSPTLPSITVVLPDATTRVFMLDFDSFPEDAADVLPVLRFRLRKLVPFDLSQAAVSYQLLPQQGGKYRALVVVLPRPILAEYEATVETAGYKAGSILSSGLATLAALQSSGPTLIAVLSDTSLTTSITDSTDLLLYRTHLLPADPMEKTSELRRDIAVAAAYFEDKLMSRPQHLLFAGLGSGQEFSAAMADPGMPVLDIAPHPEHLNTVLPHNVSIAGVIGALAGAR